MILKNKQYDIIFEHGRFLVANSGFLVSRVNYIKQSGSKKIILLDSSMSEYIRSTLYGIEPIVELLHANNNEEKFEYDIAGGVCESSDFFIRDALLPKIIKNLYYYNVLYHYLSYLKST